MTVGPIVFEDNLGKEFDRGVIETDTLRVLTAGQSWEATAAGIGAANEIHLEDLSNSGTNGGPALAGTQITELATYTYTVPPGPCRTQTGMIHLCTDSVALEVTGPEVTWITVTLGVQFVVAGTTIPEFVAASDEWLFDPGPGGRVRLPVRLNCSYSVDQRLGAGANRDALGRLNPGTALQVRARLWAKNNSAVTIADGYSPNPSSRILNPFVRVTGSFHEGAPA